MPSPVPPLPPTCLGRQQLEHALALGLDGCCRGGRARWVGLNLQFSQRSVPPHPISPLARHRVRPGRVVFADIDQLDGDGAHGTRQRRGWRGRAVAGRRGRGAGGRAQSLGQAGVPSQWGGCRSHVGGPARLLWDGCALSLLCPCSASPPSPSRPPHLPASRGGGESPCVLHAQTGRAGGRGVGRAGSSRRLSGATGRSGWCRSTPGPGAKQFVRAEPWWVGRPGQARQPATRPGPGGDA